MTDNTTELNRRTVLKSTAVTGVTGTVISSTRASSEQTIRLIEAGIRYDLETTDDLSTVQLDSRPRFTVDTDRIELVVGDDISTAWVDKIRQTAGLVAEQPAAVGESVAARDSERQVATATTELSTRMRPMRGVVLAEPTEYPRVKVQRRSATPRLIVPGAGTFELGPGTDREIELSTTTLQAQTVQETGEPTEWEDLPEHLWNAERTYGSETVQATPVVRVVDHGELTLRQAEMA